MASSSGNHEDQWFDAPQNEEELSDLLTKLEQDEEQDDFSVIQTQIESYQGNISKFQSEIKLTENAQKYYVESFDHSVRNDTLYISSVSAEQVALQEEKLHQEQINLKRLQTAERQKKEESLTLRTEATKSRLAAYSKEQQEEIQRKEDVLRQHERNYQDDLLKAFTQAESDLVHTLEKRKGEVKAIYGDLEYADDQFGGSKGRRWRVEWTQTPQPIQVQVNCIRGIRDKAPSGQYAVMISVYERLGGHMLKWSKLPGQRWSGATLPVYHDGHYRSGYLGIQQSVFTVLPSQFNVKPGMVLVFELFLLRGSLSPVDRVVGWGAFPVCNGEFEIIKGRFKVPLLRGHVDKRITKHSTIEKLISSDIDHWMANLYIEVVRLPRYLTGQKEYEVELQFSAGLLSYPDRVENAEKTADGEKVPLPSDDSSSLSDTISQSTSTVSLSDKKEDDDEDVKKGVAKHGVRINDVKTNESNTITGRDASNKLPKLTHLETLVKHTYSIPPSVLSKGRMKHTGRKNAEFLARMFLSELGWAQWRTNAFWFGILIAIVLWFARLYVHYCGQWLFLQALRLPVSSFVFFPYTVNLNYQADLLTTAEEIGVVVLGPVLNIIIQIIVILAFWLCVLVFGELPLVISKVILVWSIWTFFDPIIILIVDSALGRFANSPVEPIGDAFKLYWHFYRIEASGVVGIPLVIFLYLVLMFAVAVITYLYFLKLHNNGRIQDIYHRLRGSESDFFVPYDLELGIQELDYIVNKAEQWRGEDGERRKTSVYDYIWDEDGDNDGDGQREITRHISIHTIHLDGLMELYRHFLVMPGGAIVEIFDDVTFSSPEIKTALMSHEYSLDNQSEISSSQGSSVDGLRLRKKSSYHGKKMQLNREIEKESEA